MLKRFLVIGLALLMVLSFSTMALASNGNPTGGRSDNGSGVSLSVPDTFEDGDGVIEFEDDSFPAQGRDEHPQNPINVAGDN